MLEWEMGKKSMRSKKGWLLLEEEGIDLRKLVNAKNGKMIGVKVKSSVE